MNILLNVKPCRLLQSISKQSGNKGINEIGKEAYKTYKSRYDTIIMFKKLGLVSFTNYGREVIPTLTKKGEKALEYIGLMSQL